MLVFAHSKLYKDMPRYALCVKKREGSMHAGLFNLPGGKVQAGETPVCAALRELKKETGYVGSFPQLVGCITPGLMDYASDSFLIYIYRAIPSPDSQVVFPVEQPASWQPIEEVSNGKFVPGLSIILPLIASNITGFVLQDQWWGLSNQQSQHVLTILPHSVSEAADMKNPNRGLPRD